MSGHTSSDTSTSFEWDDYLVKINGRPADPKCFKQSRTQPENHFEVNTLLEAEDQRSAALDVQTMPTFTVDPSKSRSGSGLSVSAASSAAMSGGPGGSGGGLSRRSSLISSRPIGTVRRFRAVAFSLARVVEVWGARLRIRLFGTDDRNDCLFLVDSDQIRPYPSENPLQPPFGYIHNHLVWNRTLKKATEGAKFAETTWFIEPPPDPADNYFQVGDKLEAVDRRNTQLICPATVGAVNGQHILVRFDGWSGAFDYWTRFDSRELFPVGWCKRADFPLQPPGPNALRPRQKQETAVSFRSVSRARSRRVPNSSRKRRRKPHNLGTAQTRNPVPGALSRPLALTIQTNWTTDAPLLSNNLGLDTSHPHTESTDSFMRSLGSPPPPIIHPVIMDDDDYIDGDSLLNVTTGSSSSDPSPPSIEAAVTVTSSCTSVPTHSGHDLSSNTTNTSERPSAELADSTNGLKKKFKFIGDHPDPTPKPSSDWKSDDRLSSSVERSTVKPGQLTVDTTEHSLHPHQNQHMSHLALSADTRDGYSHLYAGSTQGYTEDYHPSNRTESASRPRKLESFFLKFPHEFDGLAEVEQDGGTIITPQIATVEADGQPTSISTRYTSTKLEYPNSKLSETYSVAQVSDDYLDSQSLAPHVSSSTVSPSSLYLGPCPLPNPSHWTIDEVCHYIATRDSSLLKVAQKFKHHEIDGQALLLLTMEALRNYLKIKLGPALKVDHLISRLKRGVL
ncbi:Polycomb protein SCMH1 [Fasciola hepatica]|uniref:Polycomb protein SCMH1 n=1 Tax=Fasciola hepatica TaxID=6192 RepID=A0A4E0RH81_FASHE|nr:Polycomb protein SCMH1 [Fasciola hepatica]